MALKSSDKKPESSSSQEPLQQRIAADAIFGDMYGQWAMDIPVIETAMGVARDFVDRPSFFTGVSDDVAGVLADLWYRVGSDPRFPDSRKRAAIFGAIFGACDCFSPDDHTYTTQFQTARDAVLEAAVRFSKRTFDEGRISLLKAFHDRLITLREYLTTFDGVSVRRSHGETLSMFDACVQVLKSGEIARAYGLPPAPPKATWPLRGEYSGQGAQLIEAISEKIRPAEKDRITRQQVLAAQRVAFDGARTVNAALHGNLEDNEELELTIIPVAFTWWTALKDVTPASVPPEHLGESDKNATLAEVAIQRSSIRPLR